MKPVITYADSEAFLTGDKLDAGLANLNSYLVKQSSKPYKKSWINKIPIIGRIYRWYNELMDEDPDAGVVLHAGDFINKDVQAEAELAALSVYKKLVDNNNLNHKLKSYRSSFDLSDDKALSNVSRIYSDVLFDKTLVDSPVSGAYVKILSELNSIAEQNGVKVGFILGNNDLDYHLFKARYEKLNLSSLVFADRQVVDINGVRVAGFGGSPEVPSVFVGGLGEYCSNTNFFDEGFNELIKDESGVDVLLVHKAYDKVNGIIPVRGSFHSEPMVTPEFIGFIDNLISHFKPDYVISGHWHGGIEFVNEGVTHVNPGSQGVLKLYSDLKPVQLVEPVNSVVDFKKVSERLSAGLKGLGFVSAS